MKVTGGCHCGQITYEAEVDPATVRVCHCTDCQTLSGTAFRTNISTLPGTFVLKSGTPRIYTKTAESGNKRTHAFCPDCGAPIYAATPAPTPLTVGLRVGGIDQRAQFKPPHATGVVQLGLALVDGPDRRARRTAIDLCASTNRRDGRPAEGGPGCRPRAA